MLKFAQPTKEGAPGPTDGIDDGNKFLKVKAAVEKHDKALLSELEKIMNAAKPSPAPTTEPGESVPPPAKEPKKSEVEMVKKDDVTKDKKKKASADEADESSDSDASGSDSDSDSGSDDDEKDQGPKKLEVPVEGDITKPKDNKKNNEKEEKLKA